MAEAEPECQIRRRRSSSNPKLPLNLDVGYQVKDSASGCQGTPSPGCVKFTPNSRDSRDGSSALLEFRKKQQSFDIQIEECEEEEILFSDDEGEGEGDDVMANRPITPTPIQDFGASVSYKEGPQTSDFLKVAVLQTECVTDVSDAESDGEGS